MVVAPLSEERTNGIFSACGVRVHGGQGENFGPAQGVLQKPLWSQTFTAPGTTTEAAGHGGQKDGEPVFTIFTHGHRFVAIGSAPDPVNGPRRFIKAWEQVTIFAEKGDKVAWVIA